MDSLRVLDTDPVDYLVTPRVLASMVAGPILNVLCFCMGRSMSSVDRVCTKVLDAVNADMSQVTLVCWALEQQGPIVCDVLCCGNFLQS